MLSRKELIQTPEYWIETLQNEIFRQVYQYMDKENLNQSQLAKKLGVSKGYISQILNGNFNFTLKKLIELSIKIGVVPDLNFIPVNTYIEEETKIINIDNYVTLRQQADSTFDGIPSKSKLKTQHLIAS